MNLIITLQILYAQADAASSSVGRNDGGVPQPAKSFAALLAVFDVNVVRAFPFECAVPRSTYYLRMVAGSATPLVFAALVLLCRNTQALGKFLKNGRENFIIMRETRAAKGCKSHLSRLLLFGSVSHSVSELISWDG